MRRAYNTGIVVRHLDQGELDVLAEQLGQALAGHPEVVFGYLYGSVLGDHGFRDVDVAIWTTDAAPADLDHQIANALATRTRLPIDIRRINDAPGSFVFHVFRGRPLIVRDELFLANLIERTARTYHDLAPHRLRAVREAFAA